MTAHTPLNLNSGDTWVITGNLYDEKKKKLNLATTKIEWVLYNNSNVATVYLTSSNGDITVVSPNSGQCQILISSATTSNIAAGSYNDALRITESGIVSTLWDGVVNVIEDKFPKR